MKLIFLNGPCGVGKSTLASELHSSLPLSFLLDIDAQRRFISQYREYRDESRGLALSVSRGVVLACLEDRRTVIIDKMIFDSSVLDEFYAIAEGFGAPVYEIILWAPKEVVMRRAYERGFREGGLLTPEKCEFFWDQIDALKDVRPQAQIINTENMSPDEIFFELTALIS
jgi:chloramphenicol 3-O-phosphotransferase